jgi:hypothetical protein
MREKRMKEKVNLNEVIEDAIRRVKAEAAEHAAKLGLPAKGTLRAADAEWDYWSGQSQDWEGEDLWRSFPESTAARIRCLWALDYCLNPLTHIEETSEGFKAMVKEIDRNLETLRTYVPKASSETAARAWLKQDQIKRQIRELKKQLGVRAAA